MCGCGMKCQGMMSDNGIGNRAAAFGSGPLFPYRKAEKERDFR